MILAILPVKGRAEQTAMVIPRLLATAGETMAPWRLMVVIDDDPALALALAGLRHPKLMIRHNRRRLGFWRTLTWATRAALAAGAPLTHLANLANDLLPGMDWLARAEAAWYYPDTSAAGHDNDGPLIAFNDGIRFDHAAHCMIGVRLARRWYGDHYWPDCYDHLFGDDELTARARAEGRFMQAPNAVLYHNHFITGQPMDAIYQFSHRKASADAELYQRRQLAGWPALG